MTKKKTQTSQTAVKIEEGMTVKVTPPKSMHQPAYEGTVRYVNIPNERVEVEIAPGKRVLANLDWVTGVS